MEQFESSFVTVESQVAGSLRIHCRKAGTKGPPILLLHGQTHYIWHKIAPRLVEWGYVCVLPDLRGYGLSSKPKGSATHVEYSKREMASDLIQLMKHFGMQQFHVVAHDRGARVAHRLALDHPGVVSSLMILDIAPTLYMYEHTDQEFATKYWHWFFNLTPNAEAIILGNPEAYFDQITKSWDGFDGFARNQYYEHFSTIEGVHGSCEDYRAAASIDLQHDRTSRDAGQKLSVPEIKVFWGTLGLIPKYGDVVKVWQEHSDPSAHVSGRALPSNHYLPEMVSEELLLEIRHMISQ